MPERSLILGGLDETRAGLARRRAGGRAARSGCGRAGARGRAAHFVASPLNHDLEKFLSDSLAYHRSCLGACTFTPEFSSADIIMAI